MIPLELSKDLNPNLIHDEICNKYTLNRLSGILKLKVNIEEEGRYMICVKYNSIKNPNLRLVINNVICDNNFCKNKTGSLDYIISVNYKNGPYFFKKGENDIDIQCSGRFPEVYEMYLEEYVPLPLQIYQYKPSDFIIIRNFNIYGGFYWNLNNIVVGLMACDIYGKIPIICMDTGFYMNNTDLEGAMIKYCPNWFSYYFEDPVKIPGSLYGYLVSTKKKIPCSNLTLKSKQNPNFVYAYNRKTFSRFNQVKKHKETCQKYLKLHSNIEKYIDHIKSKIFTQEGDNLKYIGIHYRGTDKIAEKNSPEENPIHYEYEKIYDILNQKKSDMETEDKEVYIVVTTDEQPFIDFMVEKFGDRLLYYKEALRSDTNTSGLNENFEKIVPRDKKIDTSELTSEEKKTYNLRDSLINSSLHIGYKDESNYKKGLECIIDAKLLDRCDVYYKSKGNFSLFCYYFNTKENLEYYDLNDIVSGKTD
jgi:hypothetical protein